MTYKYLMTGQEMQRLIAEAISDWHEKLEFLHEQVRTGEMTNSELNYQIRNEACYTIGRIKFYARDVEVK